MDPHLLIRDRNNPLQPERHSVDLPCPTVMSHDLGGVGTGQWGLIGVGGPTIDPETGKDLLVQPLMKLLASGGRDAR